MTKDIGRSPAGRATHEPGLASRPSHSVSVPNAAFVVTRRVGSYEYTDTMVHAFYTEAEATDYSVKAKAEWCAAVEAVPELDYPADNSPDAEWEEWERRREADWVQFRGLLSCDPGAAPEGAWQSPDEPDYFVSSVPLAQQAPSQSDDSPTRQGDAQNQSPTPQHKE